MGWYVFWAVVIVIVIWILAMSPRRPAAIDTSDSESETDESVESSNKSDSGIHYTGPVSPTEDGGWVLNPRSTFPLTIYASDEQAASKLKELLDEGYTLGTYALARTIEPIIVTSNVRCKEIDEYVEVFRPQYLHKIEELKRSSDEWPAASEKDRKDFLFGFRRQAIDSLDVIPYGVDETLFESDSRDLYVDDTLLDYFGPENVAFYLRYANDHDKVLKITPDSSHRAPFEQLVKAGLARRGTEIPLPAVLEALTLDRLNDLAAGLTEETFTSKAKAIKFLAEAPDMWQRLGQTMAFRELFQLKPLPERFSGIDLERISRIFHYAGLIAELIADTYVLGAYASQGFYDLPLVGGWEIQAADDACPFCRRAASKTYSKHERPEVPLHIGCRCVLAPKFEYRV